MRVGIILHYQMVKQISESKQVEYSQKPVILEVRTLTHKSQLKDMGSCIHGAHSHFSQWFEEWKERFFILSGIPPQLIPPFLLPASLFRDTLLAWITPHGSSQTLQSFAHFQRHGELVDVAMTIQRKLLLDFRNLQQKELLRI